jgi:hypothetical protein
MRVFDLPAHEPENPAAVALDNRAKGGVTPMLAILPKKLRILAARNIIGPANAPLEGWGDSRHSILIH